MILLEFAPPPPIFCRGIGYAKTLSKSHSPTPFCREKCPFPIDPSGVGD